MNKLLLAGRLSRDPEISTTGSGIKVAKFTVATDGFKEGETDFHRITAFKTTADLIDRFFKKGSFIMVEGKNKSGSYEKDGNTIYTYDVVADRIEFGPKTNSASAITTPGTGSAEVNKPVPAEIAKEAPAVPWQMDL